MEKFGKFENSWKILTVTLFLLKMKNKKYQNQNTICIVNHEKNEIEVDLITELRHEFEILRKSLLDYIATQDEETIKIEKKIIEAEIELQQLQKLLEMNQ